MACINICAHVKTGKHWQPNNGMDTQKYCTHWKQWVSLLLRLHVKTGKHWQPNNGMDTQKYSTHCKQWVSLLLRLHVKTGKHWQPNNGMDTQKYCTHCKQWVSLLLRLLCRIQVRSVSPAGISKKYKKQTFLSFCPLLHFYSLDTFCKMFVHHNHCLSWTGNPWYFELFIQPLPHHCDTCDGKADFFARLSDELQTFGTLKKML